MKSYTFRLHGCIGMSQWVCTSDHTSDKRALNYAASQCETFRGLNGFGGIEVFDSKFDYVGFVGPVWETRISIANVVPEEAA